MTTKRKSKSKVIRQTLDFVNVSGINLESVKRRVKIKNLLALKDYYHKCKNLTASKIRNIDSKSRKIISKYFSLSEKHKTNDNEKTVN